MKDCRVLLVMYPEQCHINPCLHFSKRLVNLGVKVTFTTSVSAFNRKPKPPSIDGVDFAAFSDGFDAGFKGSMDEYPQFYASLKARGSKAVADLITAKVKEGSPFSRVIYTTFMSWVGILADSLCAPATLLWIQPATILDVYYYYFTGYDDSFRNCTGNEVVELEGLTPLSAREFPSFLLATASNTMDFMIVQAMKGHIELINKEANPEVLVNTFDALEFDALRAVNKVKMTGIGPLVASAYLDGKDLCDTSFEGDMRKMSNGYVEWLDSKPAGCVIYVAFGSYCDVPNQMVDEIARGLVQTKRPFLWVIREGRNGEKLEEKLSCKADLEKQGKILRWCTQVEVLQHSSVGCFVTHCGWNSTLEALTFGVPVVGCPLWTDQGCNSKLIQDVWKTGVRVNVNDEGIVEADEFKRCIECVMGEGETAQGWRNNAAKLKALAKEAMREDGSSNINLKAYVEEVLLGHA